jgi:glyoxylase-like metal-dependent hydrolase (beta-lactamase superfamily II)
MMRKFQIGGTTITRIEEMMGPMFDPVRFLPDYDPTVFEVHRDWLYPDHVDEARGLLIASMHSWLIETPHHRILIDTCIGDDKPRMPFKNWHEMRTPWMSNLLATGVTPDDIDLVMCTHLHIDHVGWNTRLQDGNWVPTFPNAKYIFSEDEYNFWEAERESPNPDEFKQVNNQVFEDSVMPIMHLAELVSGETELIADLLKIKPAPGHTPGSIAIELTDAGRQGVFTGDICHHPIQVVMPEWNSDFCELPDQARATRREILGNACNHNALMLPAHFGGNHAGFVRDDADGFHFEFAN